MKTLLVIILVLFSTVSVSAKSIGYYTIVLGESEQEDIEIPDGYVAQIISYQSAGQFSSHVSVGAINIQEVNGFTIAGPETVTFRTIATTNLVATYRIFRNSSSTPSLIPASSIVIPSDSKGDVEVILESSSDLITWIPANPGTYSSSHEHRFFRVRAVRK